MTGFLNRAKLFPVIKLVFWCYNTFSMYQNCEFNLSFKNSFTWGFLISMFSPNLSVERIEVRSINPLKKKIKKNRPVNQYKVCVPQTRVD